MSEIRNAVQLSLALFLLAVAGAGTAFGQSEPASPLKVVVETSTGRSYQQKSPSGWSAIYAGRSIGIDRLFVASSDASMRLAIGALRVEILPITIAAITGVDGGPQGPKLRLRLEAGAVRVIQPSGSSALTEIDCPFGSIAAAGAEFLIDGNRLSVMRGMAFVTNKSGNRRTVAADEALIISPSGFLQLPNRAR